MKEVDIIQLGRRMKEMYIEEEKKKKKTILFDINSMTKYSPPRIKTFNELSKHEQEKIINLYLIENEQEKGSISFGNIFYDKKRKRIISMDIIH